MSPTDPAPAALERAAAVLLAGGLVVFPTDTLYALAADPRDPDAVGRVFGVKGRAAGRPLPLVAAGLEQVERSLGRLSPLTRRLADRFWPGPLTLLVEVGDAVAAAVAGESATVAVRVPGHAVARGLAAALGYPVVSTSANRSGGAAPTTADEALASLGEPVDLVLDAGAAPGGLPSTIVDARGAAPRLVRAGAIPFADVREAV